MSDKKTALVLSGGGNRGALQAGALKALFEYGFRPDALVGTSVGAINGVFIAPDPTLDQIERLLQVWLKLTKENVYPGNSLSMLWRALLGKPSIFSNNNFFQYLSENRPQGFIKFKNFKSTPLFIVAANHADGRVHVFGDDPEDSVIDALMASSAIIPLLPPWCYHDQCFVDGGLAANLPVSVALQRGATDVWAIQVVTLLPSLRRNEAFFNVSNRALSHMFANQMKKEIALLKKNNGVLIQVSGFEHLLPWDYDHTKEMITAGYRQAKEQLEKYFVQTSAIDNHVVAQGHPGKPIIRPVAESTINQSSSHV